MQRLRKSLAALFVMGGLLATGAALAVDLPPAPEPGASARIDAIRAAGKLRVGVANNDPWLLQNTTGQGDPWTGPANLLAQTYADLIGVPLEYVPVSNETKVAALPANQIDISITALGVSEERLKVVDFIVYSKNSTCMVYRTDNPKFANVQTVDDLNAPEFDLVYGIGSPDQPYLEKRFPNAKIRGVGVHIDEVISGHADSTPYNRIQAARLMKRLPEMAALPKENNCQDSGEQSLPIGMAIAKDQPVFLDWARKVEELMQANLDAEETRVVESMVQ